MKRPTWATIVGVLAIIFGGFGVLAGAQKMVMPSMIEMQKEMMANMGAVTISDDDSSSKIIWKIETEGAPGEAKVIEMSNVFESMEKELNIPDWYRTWAFAIGFVSLVLAALYFLSGVFLLMTKKYAIKFFYYVVCGSICWAIIQSVIYSQSESGFLFAHIPMAVAGIVMDVMLLVVVLAGGKDAFYSEN